MTLKQLEAFYWAATCASFAVAAQRLHLSLSSLSKRIAELEDSLGESLFDRTGHRATLTEAGSRLVPQARDLLRAADELRLKVGSRAGVHGVCRFGVGDLTALTWLPKLVKKVQHEHPGLMLEPYVDLGEVLERRVDAGELDFAVVAGTSSRSSIASTFIGEARFVWCASTELAAGLRSLTPSSLAQWALVTLPAEAGTTRIIDEWLDSRQAAPTKRITCNHWGAVAGMLIEGIGVGILPAGWAHGLQERGLLRQLKSQPHLAALRYSFQWRRDDSRPLTRHMKDAVTATADFTTGGLF